MLDDAIREHLELKRLRGADPGEVAREQQEALTAVPTDHQADVIELTMDDAGQGPEDTNDPPAGPSMPSSERKPGHVIQETAELDMRAVLEADADDRAGGPAGVRDWAQEDEDFDESSADWDVSGEKSEGSVQERLDLDA